MKVFFSAAFDKAAASESQRSGNTRSAAMPSITVEATRLLLRKVSKLSARYAFTVGSGMGIQSSRRLFSFQMIYKDPVAQARETSRAIVGLRLAGGQHFASVLSDMKSRQLEVAGIHAGR